MIERIKLFILEDLEYFGTTLCKDLPMSVTQRAEVLSSLLKDGLIQVDGSLVSITVKGTLVIQDLRASY